MSIKCSYLGFLRSNWTRNSNRIFFYKAKQYPTIWEWSEDPCSKSGWQVKIWHIFFWKHHTAVFEKSQVKFATFFSDSFSMDQIIKRDIKCFQIICKIALSQKFLKWSKMKNLVTCHTLWDILISLFKSLNVEKEFEKKSCNFSARKMFLFCVFHMCDADCHTMRLSIPISIL